MAADLLRDPTGAMDPVMATLERQIVAARDAGCGARGHEALVEAVADVAGAFRYLAGVVEQIPDAVAARLAGTGHAARETPPPWADIGRTLAMTLARSPWALVGIVGVLAVSPALREFVRAILTR